MLTVLFRNETCGEETIFETEQVRRIAQSPPPKDHPIRANGPWPEDIVASSLGETVIYTPDIGEHDERPVGGATIFVMNDKGATVAKYIILA